MWYKAPAEQAEGDVYDCTDDGQRQSNWSWLQTYRHSRMCRASAVTKCAAASIKQQPSTAIMQADGASFQEYGKIADMTCGGTLLQW
jgi:hypothetical protein